MTTSTARTRPTRRRAAVLTLPAVVLLVGCSADAEPAAPAPSAAGSSAAESTAAAGSSAAAATPSATGAADAPACPDAAVLAAAAPSQAPGVQLSDPTCSGSWAVIGISGLVGPSVQVFRYVDGAWQPADRDALCAAGELPADLAPAVCPAG